MQCVCAQFLVDMEFKLGGETPEDNPEFRFVGRGNMPDGGDEVWVAVRATAWDRGLVRAFVPLDENSRWTFKERGVEIWRGAPALEPSGDCAVTVQAARAYRVPHLVYHHHDKADCYVRSSMDYFRRTMFRAPAAVYESCEWDFLEDNVYFKEPGLVQEPK